MASSTFGKMQLALLAFVLIAIILFALAASFALPHQPQSSPLLSNSPIASSPTSTPSATENPSETFSPSYPAASLTASPNTTPEPTSQPSPTPAGTQQAFRTFNVLFKYGVQARNELNTFNDSYTKDMILDPPITIKLGLTEQEFAQIQQQMANMSFFTYPESFPADSSRHISPQVDYFIRVQNSSQVKEISWNSNSELETTISNDLSHLVSLIVGIVEQKPEYLALPMANGGYI